MENLWSSVFTPGTTPTLLVATNASFAALQVLLFVLLLATHSVHFVVLSFLCAALWGSINWFAAEVQAAQARQEKEAAEGQPHARKGRSVPGALDVATDSETETEGLPTGAAKATGLRPGQLPPGGGGGGGGARADEARQRYNAMESSGYISTDSEWEKVDEKER